MRYIKKDITTSSTSFLAETTRHHYEASTAQIRLLGQKTTLGSLPDAKATLCTTRKLVR